MFASLVRAHANHCKPKHAGSRASCTHQAHAQCIQVFLLSYQLLKPASHVQAASHCFSICSLVCTQPAHWNTLKLKRKLTLPEIANARVDSKSAASLLKQLCNDSVLLPSLRANSSQYSNPQLSKQATALQ